MKRNRALGLFAVLFFVIHACAQLQAGRPENLLWACHVADLTVGIGLLFAWPRLAGAAVLMLLVGVPLWLIDLTAGSPLYPTSLLTHLGGLTVGLWGLGPLGVRERGWLLGVAMVAVLLVASYAFTPAQANVNLIYRGWGPFNSHFATPSMHVLQLLALWSLGLWLAQCFLGWTHDLKRLVTRRQMAAR